MFLFVLEMFSFAIECFPKLDVNKPAIQPLITNRETAL